MLSVDKPDSLYPELVVIKATQLHPNENYKIRLICFHPQGRWFSEAIFRSDPTGCIRLDRDAPLRGMYTGVRAMGLFESTTHSQDIRYGGYFLCSPPIPLKHVVEIHDAAGNVLDSCELVKRWSHPDVERIVVEYEDIRATIFKPPGNGPFPTIVDWSGTGGGIHEHRAALNASYGFSSMVLAFFGYKDLPTSLNDIDVNYFLRAIDYLVSLPYTDDQVGIQGVSFGAVMAVIIAKLHPKVKCAILVNGAHAFDPYVQISNNGQPVVTAEGDNENIIFMNGGQILRYDQFLANLKVSKYADLKVEEIPKDVGVRMIWSTSDLSTSTSLSTEIISQGLRKSGHYVEVVPVNAGHIFDPPYFPAMIAIYSRFSDTMMAYGGEASMHGALQHDAWVGNMNFFKKYLGAPKPLRDWTQPYAKI